MSRRVIARANWAWLMSGVVLVAVGATMLWASSASLTRLPDATAATLQGAACQWYDAYGQGCTMGQCTRPSGYYLQPDKWYTWADYYGESIENVICYPETPSCGYFQVVIPCTQ